ncbi:hypothetical protein TNCV_217201 [Trichonephila clavipes]|nr:hypothetical protein TNCV_217201 [Trichonephila clavipes]
MSAEATKNRAMRAFSLAYHTQANSGGPRRRHIMKLRCKVVSTSATFFFTIDALPDHFLSATDPVSRNRSTKRAIIDAFGAVSPGYFC